MDLAIVDKLASQNKGVKYLLVAVDVFSRFVRVQTMKTKYAKYTLQAFIKMISRKNTREKLWVDKGTEYGGTFKKILQGKKHCSLLDHEWKKLHLQREPSNH